MERFWFIGWGWFGAGVIFLVTIILAFLLAARRRPLYGSLLSILALLLACFLWARGMVVCDFVQVGTGWIDSPNIRAGWNISFTSARGGFRLELEHTHNLTTPAGRTPSKGPVIGWSTGGALAYPTVGNPIFDHLGFSIATFSEPDAPDRATFAHDWQLVTPAWSLIPVSLILPFLHWRRHVLIPKYRRKHALCINCGYSRQSLSSDRACPECGKVPTTLASSAPLSKTTALSTS